MLELKKAHWKKRQAIITTDAVGTENWMVFTSALSDEQRKILTDPKVLHHWLGRKTYDEETRLIDSVKAMDLAPKNLVAWHATPICFDYTGGKRDVADLRLFQSADGQSAWFPRQQLEIFKMDGPHEVLYGEKPGTFVVRLNGLEGGDLLGLICSYPSEKSLDAWTIAKKPEAFNGVVEGVKPIEAPAEASA